MKQEIAEQWVAALRSGEYKQGRYALCKGDTFCCLGVLCDLHSKANGGKDRITSNGYMGATGYLPRAVVTWAGMSTRDGFMCADVAYNSLSTMNDNGASFTEIANVISSQWQQM